LRCGAQVDFAGAARGGFARPRLPWWRAVTEFGDASWRSCTWQDEARRPRMAGARASRLAPRIVKQWSRVPDAFADSLAIG